MVHTSTAKHKHGDRTRLRPGYGESRVVPWGDVRRYAYSAGLSQAEIAIRTGRRPDSTLPREWLGIRGTRRPMLLADFIRLVRATEDPETWAQIETTIPSMSYQQGSASNLIMAVFCHPAVRGRMIARELRLEKELIESAAERLK